jgi:ubiquinone/menaquinone biosynthesis C-methylase UbiE
MQSDWRRVLFPMALAAIAESSVAQGLSENEAKMFSAGAGYERFMGRWSRILANELVAFTGIKDGQRVLDVGTGTGALAAALVKSGPQVQVVGVDPSAGFIAYAQKDAEPRARFEVGDAQALKFADASFDAAMALLVLNFVPDHGKAVVEMRRVTRPGGTVSACVWDYNAGMQMLRIFWDEVVAIDPPMEPKDERHMKLSRRGQLGELWRKAGLMNVEEQALTIDQQYSSFHDYWESFLRGAGPGGAYVVSLPEAKRQELERRMRARLLKDGRDGPFTLQARAWCVKGQPPAL